MNRRALVIGIDTYDELPTLLNSGNDAASIANLLARHSDGTPNYAVRAWPNKTEDEKPVTRRALRSAIRSLFEETRDELLLYYSGHGVVTGAGTFLCTTDGTPDDWGISLSEIIAIASRSLARDVCLIFDCCHSGAIANSALVHEMLFPIANVREDMTIIAASRAKEAAIESEGHGLFTLAILDALNGGAADHLGWVTAPSLYAYVQRRFVGWSQRPVYKSHATMVNPIRQCAPLIERTKLHQLVKYFPTSDFSYRLDPEYEPEDEHGNVVGPHNQDKIATASLFKEYRDAGLLRPCVPGEQLYWTARRKHAVELTARGREYWWLVHNGKI